MKKARKQKWIMPKMSNVNPWEHMTAAQREQFAQVLRDAWFPRKGAADEKVR